jgi:hemerythrin
MESVTRTKGFETGHSVVSGEQKNLFAMVIQLNNAIEERHAKLILIETMEKLASYVSVHFKTEEELILGNN